MTAPTHNHRWVKYWVDGGFFPDIVKRGERAKKNRAVYWSILREAKGEKPVIIRKQSEEYFTNNDAEYLALREALLHAVVFHAQEAIIIYSDSRLIVNQFNGQYRVKVASLHRLRTECRLLAQRLKEPVLLEWRPREVMVDKLGH